MRPRRVTFVGAGGAVDCDPPFPPLAHTGVRDGFDPAPLLDHVGARPRRGRAARAARRLRGRRVLRAGGSWRRRSGAGRSTAAIAPAGRASSGSRGGAKARRAWRWRRRRTSRRGCCSSTGATSRPWCSAATVARCPRCSTTSRLRPAAAAGGRARARRARSAAEGPAGRRRTCSGRRSCSRARRLPRMLAAAHELVPHLLGRRGLRRDRRGGLPRTSSCPPSRAGPSTSTCAAIPPRCAPSSTATG